MSFFRALFDFSFSEFVTTKIIKILYVLCIGFAALFWLGVLIWGFQRTQTFFGSSSDMNLGVWGLLITPIGFIVQIIFTRVGYEILIVLFGIAEHTRDMAWALTGGRKAPVGPMLAQQPSQPMYPTQPQPYVAAQQPPQPRPQPYPQYPQQPPQYQQYPQQPPQQPTQPPVPPQYPPKP